MASKDSAHHPGIDVRHARSCASRADGDCDCKPGYQASVWDRRSRTRTRKTFSTLTQARAWRRDFASALDKGTVKPPTKQTLDAAAEAWLAGAKDGSIRNRSGDRFKPSVIRTYELHLRRRILPALGHLKLSDVSRSHLQDVADRMLAEGSDPSTIRNALMGPRAIFRRALNRGEIAVNPCAGIELPAVRGARDRIAAPGEAAKLLEALDGPDAALWATALYSGLRRGELQGLRWSDVDLGAGVIHVRRAWDQLDGEVEVKSRAGKRKVPIPAVLRKHLAAHKLRAGDSTGYVFGGERPFNPKTVVTRADRAWTKAKLDRITLHEARHTFASLMIAAGVNAKALQIFMGHASVTVTLDRYGHLFPGSETEAAGLLDAYLERVSAS